MVSCCFRKSFFFINAEHCISYDLGIGAGFYVDATQEPYSKHYKMYTYITEGTFNWLLAFHSFHTEFQLKKTLIIFCIYISNPKLLELPALLENEFSIGKYNLRSICGHSMGGHGALTIALKNPSSWVSVSAFSPICNPTTCPWGDKAFKAYFGEVEAGKSHDATCLLGALDKPTSFDDILIDQGDADEFLAGQLQPESLVESAKKSGQKLSMNMREGFDHSYYFIVSFIEDHGMYNSIYFSIIIGRLVANFLQCKCSHSVAFHGQRLRMKQCGSK